MTAPEGKLPFCERCKEIDDHASWCESITNLLKREAELIAENDRLENLVLGYGEDAADLEKDKQELLRLLATERDEFGKRETELMREKAAYRDIARLSGHICHRPNCLCGVEIDAEARKIPDERKP